ncbi:hypothetical protein ES332_D13G195100v1 [Gossypium tomentosum]|uniref:Uncharacterized protein n=1 Tax=Gossypium tomentosum TaxID=34277 RepID=A0A5D2I0Y1_GOSTO|nr:hypothetical protein ES332_D13G195100v1 [Gossypium tomentosum]
MLFENFLLCIDFSVFIISITDLKSAFYSKKITENFIFFSILFTVFLLSLLPLFSSVFLLLCLLFAAGTGVWRWWRGARREESRRGRIARLLRRLSFQKP